jgi:hypothetical protein
MRNERDTNVHMGTRIEIELQKAKIEIDDEMGNEAFQNEQNHGHIRNVSARLPPPNRTCYFPIKDPIYRHQ